LDATGYAGAKSPAPPATVPGLADRVRESDIRVMTRHSALPGRQFPRTRPRAFTLIEVAIATVIIGVGFTATLQLLAAGTVANKEGTELTTGIHLAGNIHEASLRTNYDDLFDLEGTHNQPLDANLRPIPNMNGWQQVVDVTYVDEHLLTSAVPDHQVEPTARVTVTVNRSGRFVYQTSWIATASE
jgi:prepilin-type N-terminal cleavage/methylation domain-containing protein